MASSVTDNNFKVEVLENNQLVLVDFWAPSCGPCKMLTPIIEELASELASKVKIVKMNIDENPNIPSEFGVRSIPTLMLFKNRVLIDSKIGVLPKAKIAEWINSNM
jgi:thioredoxin 1